MKKTNFLITSSGDLANHEIKEYLGIVSSHIITGTGFFSDFAASFTDFFGGKSGTYQKQLEKIQDEALDQLIEKAKKRGANGLISIHIDHDEISGKGMQMFMVTVYGTAVIAEISHGLESHSITTVDTEAFEKALHRRSLLRSIEASEWEFINDNMDNDITKCLLDRYLKSTPTDESEIKQKYLYCFNESDQNFMIDSLYRLLESEQEKKKELREIVSTCNLIDYDRIMQLLFSERESVQESGLILLESKKRNYTAGDLKKMIEIKYILADRFKIKVEFIEEKVMLSNKMKQKWLCCRCGNKNDTDVRRCTSCSADQYGFKNPTVNIAKISETLDTYISALEEIFDS